MDHISEGVSFQKKPKKDHFIYGELVQKTWKIFNLTITNVMYTDETLP